jgi:hypothetical protein
MFETVSLSDCYGISVGGEDEMIEKIDSQKEDSEDGMWSHRADLDNWMDDYID